jgi:hypothetical protein
MWQPFTQWLSTTYPEDRDVMFHTERYDAPRVTEESVALWEQHVQEYIDLRAAEGGAAQ